MLKTRAVTLYMAILLPLSGTLPKILIQQLTLIRLRLSNILYDAFQRDIAIVFIFGVFRGTLQLSSYLMHSDSLTYQTRSTFIFKKSRKMLV